MLPWNYGFHWNAGTLVFMGAFYIVLAIVAATVIGAIERSRRALEAGKLEKIRWHSDFQDMAAGDRVCRHVLTGEFLDRKCPHDFDCRQCETHPKLIALHPVRQPAEAEDEICGMWFPLDRFYHRGHTWARPEANGTMTVGLDELASRLMGAPDSVELPQPGTRLRVNGTAFRMRKRGVDVRLLSPVDGQVVETGGADRGWYLKVKPVGRGFDVRHLLRGSEIRCWLMREMERLQLALAAEGARAPSLADGGVPMADIGAQYPEADWDAVCGKMLLEP
jgi:glycine cleavage system H lipoate-binding protein